MQLPDLFNGTFECVGGIFLFLNVYRLYKDKVLAGVHWLPQIWFMSWGYFNIFYYPHIHQILSFYGGLVVVTANTCWLTLYLHYRFKKHES